MSSPSDNVWVGDLPIGMDKGSLASLFEPYGTVVECRVMPGKDPSAKPCAMVRFASVEMASWVVENINGNIPEGLSEAVIVRFANDNKGGKGKDKGAGDRFDPYGGGKGGGKAGFVPNTPSDNVWVGDLPVGTTKEHLAPIFECYGQIVDSRILPGRDAAAKPCAMIRFASVDMATWVVENLNGNIPQGLEGAISARYANSGGKGGGKADNSAGWGGGGGAQPWQQDTSGWGGKAAGKNGGAMGGKGKKGGAPGSFQELFQSCKGSGILGGGKAPEECQVFVKNLPPDTNDEGLYKLFSPFGAIPPNGVKAMMNPDGTCKGVGFVDFSDPSSAQTAVLALEGYEGIGVSQKKPSKGGGKGKGKDEGKGGKAKWGGGEDAGGDASGGW